MTKQQLAEYNTLNSALWYFPHNLPVAESISVSIQDQALPAVNVLVDPGAGIAMVSESFCQAHHLEYDRNPVRLSGAAGGMQVLGNLLSPVQLTFFKGTELENTVTIAGPESNADYVTVLVAKGVNHLYDFLLGNSVIRRAGGRFDSCTGQMDMRPFLQSHGDTVHMATIHLRPHALPHSASTATNAPVLAACAATLDAAEPSAPTSSPRSEVRTASPVGESVKHSDVFQQSVHKGGRAARRGLTPTQPTLLVAALMLACAALAYAPRPLWFSLPPITYLRQTAVLGSWLLSWGGGWRHPTSWPPWAVLLAWSSAGRA
jgi:hypothetical protein